MSDNKKIDRLFQEKFKDYEVFPEPNVWKGIEQQLTKKKKRRIIPLWLRLAGAAAILMLLFPVGYWFYNNNTKPDVLDSDIITNTDKNDALIKENQITDDKINLDKNDDKTSSEKDANNNDLNSHDIPVRTEVKLITTTQQTNPKNSVSKKADTIQNNVKIGNTQDNVEVVTSQQKTIEQQENNPSNQPKILEQRKDVYDTQVAISEDKEDVVNDKKSNLIEEIEKQNTEADISDVNDKKWSVGSVVGSVYMNSLSNGSPIDPSLANNTKTSNNSISYGLKVNYKISDKFSLQSGIQNVDLGYATENVSVIASSALLDKSKTNINSNLGATLQVSSTASQVQDSEAFSQNSEISGNRSPFDTNGSLDQSFSYVEVPLEGKYAIVQKKLGVNVVGGFSTYFLYNNDVSITSFGKKTSLGEASNLNNLNFSGNVGLDVNYNLSPNLFINASPMLKYQLNTFSENSGGFKPYFFGVYAGLNFRF